MFPSVIPVSEREPRAAGQTGHGMRREPLPWALTRDPGAGRPCGRHPPQVFGLGDLPHTVARQPRIRTGFPCLGTTISGGSYGGHPQYRRLARRVQAWAASASPFVVRTARRTHTISHPGSPRSAHTFSHPGSPRSAHTFSHPGSPRSGLSGIQSFGRSGKRAALVRNPGEDQAAVAGTTWFLDSGSRSPGSRPGSLGRNDE